MKTMKKTILLILLGASLCALVSCKSQYSTTELQANFTQPQIEDLREITRFFKDQICLNVNGDDFKRCYEQTPHEYLMLTGSFFWKEINFEKQRKLYEQISKSTFDKIWTFCETRYSYVDKKAIDICSVANGGYQNYLIQLGNKNPKIAAYAKRIRESGGFEGFDIRYQEVLIDKKTFDLNDPNIQLILAIQYLSLNDEATRNIELIKQNELKFNKKY
jgi:hypothetical protein